MKSKLRVSISAILLGACVLILGTRLRRIIRLAPNTTRISRSRLKALSQGSSGRTLTAISTSTLKEPGGTVKNWKFEGYPPNVLARTGFKKDVTLKIGDTLTIFAWQARSGPGLAHARELTLADGKKLYFGPPAGTGEGNAVVP